MTTYRNLSRGTGLFLDDARNGRTLLMLVPVVGFILSLLLNIRVLIQFATIDSFSVSERVLLILTQLMSPYTEAGSQSGAVYSMIFVTSLYIAVFLFTQRLPKRVCAINNQYLGVIGGIGFGLMGCSVCGGVIISLLGFVGANYMFVLAWETMSYLGPLIMLGVTMNVLVTIGRDHSPSKSDGDSVGRS